MGPRILLRRKTKGTSEVEEHTVYIRRKDADLREAVN